MLQLLRTNSDNKDFRMLVDMLDEDLALRDGEEHAFYDQFNKIANLQNVVVGYLNNAPVACGAFKPFNLTTVEIKRMFVLPEQRGKGFAAEVLGDLENWAITQKFSTFVLETGLKQPEAIRLYEKSGYHKTENYGQYMGIDNSVCMKKTGIAD